MRNASQASCKPASAATSSAIEEQRRADRQLTTFRAGRLTRPCGDELCIIRNISTGGAMIDVIDHYSIGECVHLDLRFNEQIAARVAWVNENAIGLQFEQDVDLSDIFVSRASNGSRARSPRLSVPASGRFQVQNDVFKIVTADVSQGGAKFYTSVKLTPGTIGRLWLDGLSSRSCTVRWCGDGEVGVAFQPNISVTELSAWVKCQRTEHSKMMTYADRNFCSKGT